jgi:hypothetical protein
MFDKWLERKEMGVGLAHAVFLIRSSETQTQSTAAEKQNQHFIRSVYKYVFKKYQKDGLMGWFMVG